MSNQRCSNLKSFVLAAGAVCMLGGCSSFSKTIKTSNCPTPVAIERTNVPRELESKQESVPDQAAYNKQLSQEAIQDWSKAIKAHPKCAENYRERGWEYSNIGEFDNALKDLTRAITIDPKSSDNFCKRAWVYISLGDYDAAVHDSTKAIALDRLNTSAYEARSDAYSSLGKDVLATKDQEWLHKN